MSTSSRTGRRASGRPHPTVSACRSTSSTTSTRPLDGTAPGVIYGYGAYEASMPPWFSVARLSLLDRGFVWALVHPRGGGELGRQWYLDGKFESKANTFTDTIACARTSRRHEGRRGRSALHPRRIGRRAARRRVHHDAPRPVRQRGRRGPVRRHRLDDERPDAAAHRHRVGGVGRPARRAVRERDERVLALRQHDGGRLPGDLRDRRPQRPAGERPRTGEVDGPPSVGEHRRRRRSCCAPRWVPATADPPAATTPGATRPEPSPSSSPPPDRLRRPPPGPLRVDPAVSSRPG